MIITYVNNNKIFIIKSEIINILLCNLDFLCRYVHKYVKKEY